MSPPSATAGLPLRARAPAKINLGLFIGPHGASGRHELVSVMQSISLADQLTLEPGPHGSGEDAVICPGVPGDAGENLAARALRGFRALTGWDGPPLRLTVDKRIPVAAGLGGGSADAAATLRLLAEVAGLEAHTPALLDLAARLGSDVPAQVRPGCWLVSGAGERLEPLPAPRPPFGVLVVAVPAALSTATVYGEADRLRPPRSAAELEGLHQRLAEASATGAGLPPAELLGNDLEGAARSLCPAIDGALGEVRRTGADTALVSGSGPTVLGLFGGEDGARRAELAAAELARERVKDGQESAPMPPLAAVPVDDSFGRPVAERLPALRDVTIARARHDP